MEPEVQWREGSQVGRAQGGWPLRKQQGVFSENCEHREIFICERLTPTLDHCGVNRKLDKI